MSCRNAEEPAPQPQRCADAAEPTSEQVDAERERAHAVSCLCRADFNVGGMHNVDCDRIAIALARVRAEK